jgi:hypothetical protein
MSNLSKIVSPPEWSSAWRPIRFEYDYLALDIVDISELNGNTVFIIAPWNVNPVMQNIANDSAQILVEGNIYEGLHNIIDTGANGTQLFTDTPFVGGLIQGTVKILWRPVVSLLISQFNSPFESIGKFNTDVAPDNLLKFGVEGLVRSNWQFKPPVVGVDYNMFRHFKLRFEYRTIPVGGFTELQVYKVLNSSIKTDELNQLYVNTGAILQEHPPFVFSCAPTIQSTISGTVVINKVIEDGDITVGDYHPNDYNNDDYFTG